MSSRYVRLAALVAVLCGAWRGLAQSAPSLGSAASFAVLGGSVTNSGSTTIIAGNVGTSPGNTAPGLSRSNFILGDPRLNDSLAQQAQKDSAAAYEILAARSSMETLTGDLGGRTLGPGVYRAPQGAMLTGPLVLDTCGNPDTCGDPDSVWIFEIDGSLTTAAGSTVQTINEGRDNNVFWRIGGSATFGTKSVFVGNVLATANITVGSTATVSGRLLTPGAVSLTDAGVTICCALLDMAPHVLPNGMAGTEYNQALTPKGGNGSYKFALAASDLQSGVTLTESGALSVKPTAKGVFKLAVAVSDSTGINCVRVYRLVICGPITLSPVTLDLVACVPYDQTITTEGGTPPYKFTSGPLPEGLYLEKSGDVSARLFGTPTTVGDYDFTVTATDVFGCTGSRRYAGAISAAFKLLPDAGTLREGIIGEDYSALFEVTGGSGTYTFSFSGTIPPGLLPRPGVLPSTSSSTQELAGKPTAGGCYKFTVSVTTCGVVVSNEYTLVIRPVPVTFSPDDTVLLPPATVCKPYCKEFSASACTGTYTFDEVPAGALPPGLTFDPKTRTLCGTPTQFGHYYFSLTARDGSRQTASHKYSLEVLKSDISIDRELPAATACVYYKHQLVGCDAACTFSPGPGGLPKNLKLSDTGLLHGTPAVPGDYTFNVTVERKGCPPHIVSLHLIVLCNVTISPAQLPNGRLGISYNRTLTASCGTPAYTFSVVSGPLPDGLTLYSAGELSGVPTALGCFTFRVRATDDASPVCIGEHTYQICIFPIPAAAAPALSGWGMILLSAVLILIAMASTRGARP